MSVKEVLNSLDLMFYIVKLRKVAQLEYLRQNFMANKKLLINELKYIEGNYEYSDNLVCSNCDLIFKLNIYPTDVGDDNKCFKCILAKIYEN